MRSPRPPGWWQCLLPLGDYRPPHHFLPSPFLFANGADWAGVGTGFSSSKQVQGRDWTVGGYGETRECGPRGSGAEGGAAEPRALHKRSALLRAAWLPS